MFTLGQTLSLGFLRSAYPRRLFAMTAKPAVSQLSVPVSISKGRSDVSKQTGAFKTILPDIFTGTTHFKRALKELKGVSEDMTIKNVRNRHRKLSAQSLDTVMKGLTRPITSALAAYDIIFKRIHPYEVCQSIRLLKLI